MFLNINHTIVEKENNRSIKQFYTYPDNFSFKSICISSKTYKEDSTNLIKQKMHAYQNYLKTRSAQEKGKTTYYTNIFNFMNLLY